MTKNNRAVPDALADAVPAVAAIPVLPKPITKSFTVTSAPAARDAIVPDFVFPTKMSFPSRSMVQSMSVRSSRPRVLYRCRDTKSAFNRYRDCRCFDGEGLAFLCLCVTCHINRVEVDDVIASFSDFNRSGIGCIGAIVDFVIGVVDTGIIISGCQGDGHRVCPCDSAGRHWWCGISTASAANECKGNTIISTKYDRTFSPFTISLVRIL